MRDGSRAGIAELVRQATVVVGFGATAEVFVPEGTGFLVAPGRVLTCAHVVQDAAQPDLAIRWHGAVWVATARRMEPQPATAERVPAPDTAVLEVPDLAAVPHPAVPLDDEAPAEGDAMYAYGITEVRSGRPEWDSSRLHYDGPAADEYAQLYKLSGDETFAPGQSGAALLNLTTYRVCGIVKQTMRDGGRNVGWAVPITAALAVADEPLLELNRAMHGEGLPALRAAQATFEPLPTLVASDLTKDNGTGQIVDQLRALSIEAPTTVAPEDVTEWAARRLFGLRLVDLVQVLTGAALLSGDARAAILWKVASCLPADEQPESWWLPGEAVVALRTEWATDRPRIAVLASDEPRTAEFLTLRATNGQAKRMGTVPFSAELDPRTGLPADLDADIRATLAVAFMFDPNKWDSHREQIASKRRGLGRYVVVPPSALAEPGFLAGLLAEFGGLLFLISTRSPVPDGRDDVLLQLKPLVDPDVDWQANDTLGLLDV